MAIIISVFILSILISIFITIPFYRKIGQDRVKKNSTDLSEDFEKLNLEKEIIYQELKDIEFDFKLGKLSKSDYEELKNKYMLKATDVIRKLESS